MNTRYYFLIVLWAMSLFAPLHAQTYDKMWKEVEQLQKKDLPQSVAVSYTHLDVYKRQALWSG